MLSPPSIWGRRCRRSVVSVGEGASEQARNQPSLKADQVWILCLGTFCRRLLSLSPCSHFEASVPSSGSLRCQTHSWHHDVCNDRTTGPKSGMLASHRQSLLERELQHRHETNWCCSSSVIFAMDFTRNPVCKPDSRHAVDASAPSRAPCSNTGERWL